MQAQLAAVLSHCIWLLFTLNQNILCKTDYRLQSIVAAVKLAVFV